MAPRSTQEELILIANWIDAGARYDGEDRDSPLGQKTAEAKVEIEGLVQASGEESVQFNRDLAETLVTHCAGCHGGDTPSGHASLGNIRGSAQRGRERRPIEAGQARREPDHQADARRGRRTDAAG